ncbi:hypothetical protein FHS14_005656 [Paenibacillus baekrokdamisoli]|uniref:hypothetical protein n=1 Tax=Paenibacillus baekrokdamisoli TaxID=1712516 RepID=UPI0013E04D2C|nr:hypothetical protein [Paenibacillus baekrokdamisoli]MBB3072622.1 hypothetical protein [Paenibacillus baekrokdamisoli]
MFTKEFAVIREGEVLIIELWYQYNARKLVRERKLELTEQLLEEARVAFPPPTN